MWIAAGAAAPASELNGREKLVIATGSNPSQKKVEYLSCNKLRKS